MRDHLSRGTAFAGQKRWSLNTGSTVVAIVKEREVKCHEMILNQGALL